MSNGWPQRWHRSPTTITERLFMKAFNDLADFEHEEIAALLELANRLDAHPEPGALQAGRLQRHVGEDP